MGLWEVNMAWRSWSVAMALAALCAAPAAAQDWKGRGRFEGRVVDADGKPIVGATVRLELPERGGSTTVETDKKGRWALAGVAAGQWNVDIVAAGYAPRRGTFNLPSENARLSPMVTTLEKAGPPPPDPALMAAVQRGDEAYKAGRFAEARVEYEKVLALKPELGSTLHELIARCYSQEGNYAKAVEHLEKVIAEQPANVTLRVLAAQEALRGNMLDKGMLLLSGIDDSAVKNPEIFYNIAVILRNHPDAPGETTNTAKAVEYLGKAIALDPRYVDGYMQRGLAYLGLQKLAEAKADFQKVVELAPGTPQAEMAQKAIASLR
jgi:tetratricopeptide (TPR) repeat protein